MTELPPTLLASVARRGRVSALLISVLILNEAFDAGAQYCFKRAADAQAAPVHFDLLSLWAFVCGAVSQGYLWLGVIAIAAVFINWSVILSKIEVSVAVPLTSVSYIFVALVSVVFLHEHISPTRWLGILFILIGVFLVARSSEGQEHSP